MAKLEELTAGANVLGIDPQGAVVISSVQWQGDDVVELIWKDSAGHLGTGLFFRHNEPELSIRKKSLSWSFAGDGEKLRLLSEAWRIHYAHLFDPYLAVHSSDVEPLPHQISAVYQEMLGRSPLRYVLADDPGAGKTIMTGLLIRELIARGDLCRCLIICPGNLVEQWREELYRKFHLHFEIITNDRIESAVTGNVFMEVPLAISRMDKLARDASLLEKLKAADWDLVVCDEAHKMSAHVYGGEVKRTSRFELGQLLSGLTRHFLLLTATPHNGKEEEFQLFLSLVDQDRFAGAARAGGQAIDVSDIMRRLVKEELLKFDGSPLFPNRQARTLNYDLSEAEAELYEAVTRYVRNQFNQADNLDKKRRATVGFALTILQRRLASSPEAIYQSLKRRGERLKKRLEEEKQGRAALQPLYADFDEDELTAAEFEETSEEIADRASASSTVAELEAEIAALASLEKMAHAVRASGRDRKWEELSRLLQEKRMFDAEGTREKLIIFTEHRDTLRYLEQKIASLLGNSEYVAVIHGGMNREERRKMEQRFMQDKLTLVLVATDAAGEGLNLQRARLMINYDLPWNPNRLEQRFGRIHRIGQTRTCWLWNLVAGKTREGAVFDRLFKKLEKEREALGGKVFDILGKLTFNNRPLRELLVEAIRHGDESDIQAVINSRIDAAVDPEAMRRLLAERALTADVMDAALVANMAEEMERREARRLQPHFIEDFFREAFQKFGGRMTPREKGRFEITFIPATLRHRQTRAGAAGSVLQRYERVCFDKTYIHGQVEASLICPGHPLLDALLDILREEGGDLMKTGAILIDENNPGEDLRLLFYIDAAIQDGTIVSGGNRRVIDRRIHFVELGEDGKAKNAGYAPYLDYRGASEEERQTLLNYVRNNSWLKVADVEKLAVGHAIKNLVPGHLEEIRKGRFALLDKTEKAVRERLSREIRYWDRRAWELKEEEKTGKRNASLNSSQAGRRSDDLEARLKKRLAEIERERQISALPPNIAGGTLIAPKGLLVKLMGGADNAPADFTADAAARKIIEEKAMNAVLAIEHSLGFMPKKVSEDKCGYDVESRIPENLRKNPGETLRFIEVKGRAKGADSVTITRNEILYGLTQAEKFILALVEVDGDRTKTIYLKKPFKNPVDSAMRHSSFSIAALLKDAEKVFEG